MLVEVIVSNDSPSQTKGSERDLLASHFCPIK